MKLSEFFYDYPFCAVAFSGGVDSAYLLYEAAHYCKKVTAYFVKSDFQPQFELDDALLFAEKYNIELKVLYVDILSDKEVCANSSERCYLCKKHIMSAILKQAAADGYNVLFDGTNASDAATDRPGMRALNELSVLSPLRLCGLTKDRIRELSREMKLFTWDKPAYACLATRILTGEEITSYKLQRTEWAEKFLYDMGFRDFRVRTNGNLARLQIRSDDFMLVVNNRKQILDVLTQKYYGVSLDLGARDE